MKLSCKEKGKRTDPSRAKERQVLRVCFCDPRLWLRPLSEHEETYNGNEDVRKDLLGDRAGCLDKRKERRVAFGGQLQDIERVGSVGGTNAPMVVEIYCGWTDETHDR
jgi:hypothetical protein